MAEVKRTRPRISDELTTTPSPPTKISRTPSPEALCSDDVVLIAASMYPDPTDVRFNLAVNFCKSVARERVWCVVCDDSPEPVRDVVRKALVDAGEGRVDVVGFEPGETGRKGAAIRRALRRALEKMSTTTTTTSQRKWAVVFTELEKVDFVRFARLVAAPILRGQAEVVVPERDLETFRETYPTEQFHSEMFGNAYASALLRNEPSPLPTTPPMPYYVDAFFGPMAWDGASVSRFYLEYDGEMWDAQLVPAVEARRQVSARWTTVRVAYRHDPDMRAQEEGSVLFCAKRAHQLDLLMSVLTRVIRDATLDGLPRVIVAGANGNIGGKIVSHLASQRRHRLVLMDKNLPSAEEREKQEKESHGLVSWVFADFTTYDRAGWPSEFEGAAAAFLLAARNPMPEADSKDAFWSMVMTCNMLEACSAGRVGCVVYASSNHIVGGLRTKDGPIHPDAEPDFGTKFTTLGANMDATPYASAKAAGEAEVRAMVASGRLTKAVIWRIGWCQPGANRVESMTLTGSPYQAPSFEKKKKNESYPDDPTDVLGWFRAMHLKNDDLCCLTDATLAHGASRSSASNNLVFVNAVSEGNDGSRWIVPSGGPSQVF